ncbi:hypothetical protein DD607_05060 [Salmonella sp. 3DZ2-4SM]|nr:hypothetical protein [Mammaliicoccus sciuri]QRN92724.1 hypothetical protein JRU67_14985 [Mammaliicoccus sciuri]RXY94805.1 hypothetical protein DD607_05060 [Salmonella sp. 3DZ2-4SM]
MSKYKKKYKPKTNEERLEEIRTLTGRAKDELKRSVQSSTDIMDYLEFMSKFHKYSYKNQSLIREQYRGTIGAVKSAKQWNKNEGLYIRKGQKAIKIFAPTQYDVYKINGKELSFGQLSKEMQKKAKNNELEELKQKRTGFILVPVFDISQTTAKPEQYPDFYPNKPIDYIYKGDNIKTLDEATKQYIESNDIDYVEDAPLDSAARGVHSTNLFTGEVQIKISDNATETEKLKVAFHEMAHHHLHKFDRKTPLHVKETEAEMTAYVVSSYYQIDTKNHSLDYVNKWTEDLTSIDDQSLENVFENIQRASKQIIEGIDYQIEQIADRERSQERFLVKGLGKDYQAEERTLDQANYDRDFQKEKSFEMYELYDKEKEKSVFVTKEAVEEIFKLNPDKDFKSNLIDATKNFGDEKAKEFVKELDPKPKQSKQQSSLEME